MSNLLATIHIVKKEAGLTDEKYRNILEKVTGFRSAKDLNADQLRVCISAISGNTPLKNIKIQPRESFKSKFLSSRTPERKWNIIPGTEEQWKNIGYLINAYSKQGISLVGVWPAYGEKYLKWRYKDV